MNNQLVVQSNNNGEIMERVLMAGDLSQLQPMERVNYYNAVCQSVGLNPLTKPFEYIKLNGKLVLYARKDATEQLRRLHGISITSTDVKIEDDLIIITATASDQSGRSDTDLGVVGIGNLRGDAKANAIMKAMTKAKRRVTLSLAGLGWLDETEIETIPTAVPVAVDETSGEIVEMEDGIPIIDQSLYDFTEGDEVIVHGKNDEKPGLVVGIDGALVVVEVDGKEFKVSPKRLTLIEPLLSDEEE